MRNNNTDDLMNCITAATPSTLIYEIATTLNVVQRDRLDLNQSRPLRSNDPFCQTYS